jgi:hypothetical protein
MTPPECRIIAVKLLIKSLIDNSRKDYISINPVVYGQFGDDALLSAIRNVELFLNYNNHEKRTRLEY